MYPNYIVRPGRLDFRGVVFVTRLSWDGRERATWVRCRSRKPHTCRACGKDIRKGETAYRPVGNQSYRMERLCDACVGQVFPNARYCPLCERLERDLAFDDCCDGPTTYVRVSACSDPNCEHDDHHWGHHCHVTPTNWSR